MKRLIASIFLMTSLLAPAMEHDNSNLNAALIGNIMDNDIHAACVNFLILDTDTDIDEACNLINWAKSPEMLRLLLSRNKMLTKRGQQPSPHPISIDFMAKHALLTEERQTIYKEVSIDKITKNRQVIRILIQESPKLYDIESIQRVIQHAGEKIYCALLIHMLKTGTTHFSALVNAIDCSDLEAIQSILGSNPDLVNYRDEFGCTPLAYALHCRYKPNLEIIRALLLYGANLSDPIIIDLFPCFALHIAIQRTNIELATLLKEFGETPYGKSFIDSTGTQMRMTMALPAEFASIFADDECPICLEAMKDATAYQCGHIICESCHTKIRDCPICRKPH